MTADLLIPAPLVKSLPISLDSDLVVDFRNRDPADSTVYLDYPSGVTGILTIYADLKTPGTERITVSVTPQSYHCTVKIDAHTLNPVVNQTLWSFRLNYPDTDLPDGLDKVVANGTVVRSDGRTA